MKRERGEAAEEVEGKSEITRKETEEEKERKRKKS